MSEKMDHADEDLVVLEDVEKIYKVGGTNLVPALRHVNLKLGRGSMVTIKGSSGSGKTTLLQLIGALDVPSSGSIRVNGKELSQMSQAELTAHRASTVGFVFQTFNLIPNLTATENVEIAMEATGVPRLERRERAHDLLKTVGVYQRKDYMPLKLSGGEQQRVAIARALANNPLLILADEPTGALDSKTGKSIVGLMKKLRQTEGTTIIIVSHDHNIARMTDSIINIRDGKIADIKEVGDEEAVLEVSKTLDLHGQFVRQLFTAGYDDIAKITRVSKNDLLVNTKFKQKDINHILNRINKYSRKTTTAETARKTILQCSSCSMAIPMTGAKFCPFCSEKI